MKKKRGCEKIPVCDLKPGQSSTFFVSQIDNRPVNCIQLRHWPSSHDEIIIKIQKLYTNKQMRSQKCKTKSALQHCLSSTN
jgi:hypothetical protein